MDFSDPQFILVIWGFIIAFILAFGIGANDVANSFGTSVGSKVLTLKQACILATIFEILGSILIGANVSGTIRKGILDPLDFQNSETELMLGYVSALVGCCIWLILATILNLPVSGTHSIVGSTIGMAIVSKGFRVIKWMEIMKIVASWFISPLLSGVVSLVMFILIRKFILRAQNPLKAGLRFLPLIYTITIFVNVGGIVESGPEMLKMDKIPMWGKILIVVIISAACYVTVWLLVVPLMKKKIEKTLALSAGGDEGSEKEKFNLEHTDNGKEKKSMSTQVDYVALIMAKHDDANKVDRVEEEKMIGEHDNELEQSTVGMKGQQPNRIKKIPSYPNSSSMSVHSDNIKSSKRNRVRLISAPTSAPNGNEPQYDYSDVTLTLGGYLHSIHSSAMRNHIKAQMQKANLQAKMNSNQQSILPGAGSIFRQTSVRGVPQKEDQPSDLAKTSGENVVSEKRGRFNCVPAALSTNVEAVEKISNKSLIEIDADVEENISELPNKKQKRVDVDEFALVDPPEAAKLFSFLQVLTAIFGSFAHGGNDVSNAIGPLIGLYLIYQDGKIVNKAETPSWILFYGGVGISVGLWILGRRVIKTIGEDLTKITASSGFVIELASAMTVLGASLLKIPVSTTHCKVGSVVFTGRVRSKQSVDWSLFRNIIIAWIVTVPVTGSIAAGCQYLLKLIYKV